MLDMMVCMMYDTQYVHMYICTCTYMRIYIRTYAHKTYYAIQGMYKSDNEYTMGIISFGNVKMIKTPLKAFTEDVRHLQ